VVVGHVNAKPSKANSSTRAGWIVVFGFWAASWLPNPSFHIFRSQKLTTSSLQRVCGEALCAASEELGYFSYSRVNPQTEK